MVNTYIQSTGEKKIKKINQPRITWVAADQWSWREHPGRANRTMKGGPGAQRDGTQLAAACLTRTAEAVQRAQAQKEEL